MTTPPTATGPGWELRCCDCLDSEHGLASIGKVDHVITDPPYSERTHAGQRTGRRQPGNMVGWTTTVGLSYEHITSDDVTRYATTIGDARKKWALVMTDHTMFAEWEVALPGYTFAPVPIVREGMNVRLAGDGPSNWTIWLCVNRAAIKDGTKPGAYVGSPGEFSERNGCPIKGTKPLWLMERLLRDYTKPGDLVADPFTGSGTTGVACVRLGRRFIGWEREPAHFEYAVRRLRAAREQMEMWA